MFTIRYFTRIVSWIRFIGDTNMYYDSDKTMLNAHFFTENNYRIIPQNNIVTMSKWDFDWDKRGSNAQLKLYSDEVEGNEIDVKSKPARHIILVRHGQYKKNGESDKEKVLTSLGIDQAKMAGKRLKELDIPYSGIIHSTMTRAAETAKIISSLLPDVPLKKCILLKEGSPIPPEPPLHNWKPPYKFHQDGARIEAAFRKYFHRADSEQKDDTYTIIVCHANVIRYFVCRALQYPAEGWLRLTLRHGSLTWLIIKGTGKVELSYYGDAGYMPPNALTES